MKHHVLILMFLAGLVFFQGLGEIPLVDPDEPRYAQSASEMMVSGDWINPRFSGENRWDKPILFYWMILGSYALFGVSEAAARLPSAVFATLTLFLVYAWCRRWLSAGTGLLSALVLGTSMMFSILGRIAITDMTLVFFMSFALVTAFDCWKRSDGRGIWLAYASSALACLTKGPVGVLLPAGAFLVFLWASRNLGFLRQCRIGTGACVFLLICAPWYVTQCLLYPDFFNYFFVVHNVKRFASDALKHSETIFYYIPILAAGLFPWSIFLPKALWLSLKAHRKDPVRLYCLVWAAVIIVFFSLSRAKVGTYVLGAFVPLSVLVALYWEEMFERGSDKSMATEAIALVATVIAAMGAGFFYFVKTLPQAMAGYWSVAPVAVAGCLAAALYLGKAKAREAFAYLTGTCLVVIFGLVQFLGPPLSDPATMKTTAQVIKEHGLERARIGFFLTFKPSLVYYLGRPVEHIATTKALELFFRSRRPRFCILKYDKYVKLKSKGFLDDARVLRNAFGKVLIHRPERKTVLGLES